MRPLPKPPTGDHPFVTFCRDLLKCVQERTPLAGRNITVSYEANGVRMNGTPKSASPLAASAPSGTKMFRVVSIQGDYVVARQFDGSSESGPSVNIALPFRLRRTPFHNQTITYNVEGTPLSITYTYGALAPLADYSASRIAGFTIGSTPVQETQRIIPIYSPNRDVIYATEPENGTGVAAATWEDLNVDGRAWCRI